MILTKEVNTARFWVKKELEGKHLTLLPDHVKGDVGAESV